jgi:hypothetical protein
VDPFVPLVTIVVPVGTALLVSTLSCPVDSLGPLLKATLLPVDLLLSVLPELLWVAEVLPDVGVAAVPVLASLSPRMWAAESSRVGLLDTLVCPLLVVALLCTGMTAI